MGACMSACVKARATVVVVEKDDDPQNRKGLCGLVWEELPAAVLLEVLDRLPHYDLQAARLVCRTWRAAVNARGLLQPLEFKGWLISQRFPHVTALDLRQCGTVTDPMLEYCSWYSHLTSLSLSGASLRGQGLAALARCGRLQALSLAGAAADVQDNHLLALGGESGCISLTSLSLRGCPGISVAGALQAAHGLTALQRLEAVGVGQGADDAHLAALAAAPLPRLRELLLQVPKALGDAGLAALTRLPPLETLCLTSSAAEASSAAQQLPDGAGSDAQSSDAGSTHAEPGAQLLRDSTWSSSSGDGSMGGARGGISYDGVAALLMAHAPCLRRLQLPHAPCNSYDTSAMAAAAHALVACSQLTSLAVGQGWSGLWQAAAAQKGALPRLQSAELWCGPAPVALGAGLCCESAGLWYGDTMAALRNLDDVTSLQLQVPRRCNEEPRSEPVQLPWRLQRLHVQECYVAGCQHQRQAALWEALDPAPLRSLTQLVARSGHMQAAVDAAATLPLLQSLELSPVGPATAACDELELAPLSSLTQLVRLVICSCQAATGLAAAVSRMTALQQLHVCVGSGSEWDMGEGGAEGGVLPLELHQAPLALSALRQLRQMTLSPATQLRRTALHTLGCLTTLRTLRLDDCTVPLPAALEELKGLTGLRRLHLTGRGYVVGASTLPLLSPLRGLVSVVLLDPSLDKYSAWDTSQRSAGSRFASYVAPSRASASRLSVGPLTKFVDDHPMLQDYCFLPGLPNGCPGLHVIRSAGSVLVMHT